MISVPVPHKIHGDRLTEELAAAGLPGAQVRVVGDRLEVDAEGATEAKVQQVVAAHVPPPPPPNPQDEFRKAVEGATTLAALKAAILGSTGPGAQPRGR